MEKYLKRIKLPPVSYFDKSKKADSPYIQLQQFVIQHFGGKDTCPITQVSDICIHPVDSRVLDKVAFMWAKKKMPGFTKKYVDSQLAFHRLDCSPSDSDETIEPGFIYIRKPVE